MYTTSRGAFPGFASVLALYLSVATAMGDWVYSYCSSQNTAADSSPLYWDYQSNGKCHDYCVAGGDYAFAVIQDKNCWCSNYIPQEQSDISDCSDTCPGFSTENCGKSDQYYVYVKLDGTPSGTAGASRPSPTNVSPSSEASSSSSPPPETNTIQSDKASSSLQTTTSTIEDLPSSPPPARTSLVTVTQGNNVITQTVVENATGAPQPVISGKSAKPIGAIVGGTLGGIGLLAAIVAGVMFLLWRRRKQQRSEAGDERGVSRNVSTMSKAGLLRTEKHPQFPPPIATAFNKRHSRTLDQDSISPISASDRRNSSFRVDQRLNPSTLFVFDNGSRDSVGSLDDSRDYHRTLNVRNPDAQ